MEPGYAPHDVLTKLSLPISMASCASPASARCGEVGASALPGDEGSQERLKVTESASRPLIDFGVLNDNLIKGLISCIK
jgi:hypothetical protein